MFQEYLHLVLSSFPTRFAFINAYVLLSTLTGTAAAAILLKTSRRATSESTEYHELDLLPDRLRNSHELALLIKHNRIDIITEFLRRAKAARMFFTVLLAHWMGMVGMISSLLVIEHVYLLDLPLVLLIGGFLVHTIITALFYQLLLH